MLPLIHGAKRRPANAAEQPRRGEVALAGKLTRPRGTQMIRGEDTVDRGDQLLLPLMVNADLKRENVQAHEKAEDRPDRRRKLSFGSLMTHPSTELSSPKISKAPAAVAAGSTEKKSS